MIFSPGMRLESLWAARHLGADSRHKTIADFLAAIERRRHLAQPPRKGGEVSGQL